MTSPIGCNLWHSDGVPYHAPAAGISKLPDLKKLVLSHEDQLDNYTDLRRLLKASVWTFLTPGLGEVAALSGARGPLQPTALRPRPPPPGLAAGRNGARPGCINTEQTLLWPDLAASACVQYPGQFPGVRSSRLSAWGWPRLTAGGGGGGGENLMWVICGMGWDGNWGGALAAMAKELQKDRHRGVARARIEAANADSGARTGGRAALPGKGPAVRFVDDV